MNEQVYWELIQKNAGHIATMNREMGVVQTQVSLIFYLVLGLAGKASWEVLGRIKQKINGKK